MLYNNLYRSLESQDSTRNNTRDQICSSQNCCDDYVFMGWTEYLGFCLWFRATS